MNLLTLRRNLIDELKPFIENKIILKNKISIWEQESERDKIIILLDGTLKISHMQPNYKEILLGIYKSNMVFFPPIFNKENTFSSLFKISTISSCSIGTISTHTLKKIISENVNILQDLVLYHDYISQQTFLQMRDISTHSKKLALFSILIRLHNTYGINTSMGSKIDIKLSNIILSEYIGSSPETISRLLCKLKNDNIIHFKNGFLTIKNLAYLKNCLGCCRCNENLCLF